MGERRDEPLGYFRSRYLVEPDTVGFLDQAKNSVLARNRQEEMAFARRGNSGFHLSDAISPFRVTPDAVVEQSNNDGGFCSVKIERVRQAGGSGSQTRMKVHGDAETPRSRTLYIAA